MDFAQELTTDGSLNESAELDEYPDHRGKECHAADELEGRTEERILSDNPAALDDPTIEDVVFHNH